MVLNCKLGDKNLYHPGVASRCTNTSRWIRIRTNTDLMYQPHVTEPYWILFVNYIIKFTVLAKSCIWQQVAGSVSSGEFLLVRYTGLYEGKIRTVCFGIHVTGFWFVQQQKKKRWTGLEGNKILIIYKLKLYCKLRLTATQTQSAIVIQNVLTITSWLC